MTHDAPPVSVYLDANFFIRLVEDAGSGRARHLDLWDAVAFGKIRAVTSWITWGETLVHPLRERDDDLVDLYDDIFAGREAPLSVVDVTPPVLRESARICAANPPLKLADAIHVATFGVEACGRFVSSDRRLAYPLGGGFLNPDSPDDVPRFLAALP